MVVANRDLRHREQSRLQGRDRAAAAVDGDFLLPIRRSARKMTSEPSNSSMPKVSVLLTSFNHSRFIREAIDSVLHQTFADFELLILDDASTDDSWWIINSYRDPRIKAIRTSKKGEI